MALVRALNTAISGLRAQQFRTDVIGDNLANVTTTSFKEGRAQFQTMLSQTLAFGTAPQGFSGGVDPRQLGLGVRIADTNRNFSQGALEATGRNSDLAIEGDGFFILRDNNGAPIYTRDGSFTINPVNLLHNPTNGFIVQGYQADFQTFTLPVGGPLTNIEIPVGDLRIAQATSRAVFDGNLNAGGPIAHSGTVLHSQQFLELDRSTGTIVGPATTNTLLVNLVVAAATPPGYTDLGIVKGDRLYLDADKGGRAIPTKVFQVGTLPPFDALEASGTTLGDLMRFLEGGLGINDNRDTTLPGRNLADDTFGALIRGNDATIPDADGLLTGGGNEFLDYTTYVRDSTDPNFVDWVSLGVQAGDFIRFVTGDGTGQIAQIESIASTNVANDTLVFSPNNRLDTSLPLPAAGDAWQINERARVSLTNDAANPNVVNSQEYNPRDILGSPEFADGIIRIAGNNGLANDLDNLVLTINQDRLVTTWTRLADAQGESVISNATVYDSLGKPHVLEITYVLQSTADTGNVFRWYAESEDSFSPSTGNYGYDRVVGSGWIKFSTTGKFIEQNPMAAINLVLENTGANTVVITPDHSNVTGFNNQASEVALVDQDGFAQGTLTDFSIGQDGIVTGIFSNGMTRTIAQIALARFQNNHGLMLVGENLYQVGANSGIPIIGTPGTFARGVIHAGFLEESNVDLAKQFTDLIVSQRAFQANARTITVSNQMLQDLVNIV